ncbi:MAG: hypothetical protein AAF718_15105 [Pseudomonadota bacterium]
MRGMFDNERPDPVVIDRVKAMFVAEFELSEDTMLSVAELRCHEPGCPPIETVVTARSADGKIADWRVHKPMKGILSEDVAALYQRARYLNRDSYWR